MEKIINKIYKREVRHIIANFRLRNKGVGYNRYSNSATHLVIEKLLNLELVEREETVGRFMFVKPAAKLLDMYNKKT